MTDLQIKISRIRQLDKDLIPEAIEDLERYRAIATTITPQYENDGAQHNSNGNGKEKAFQNCAEASAKIDLLQDELVNLKLEVEEIINDISNDKERRFAKLYYIDQLTQKKIASQSHYAFNTVRNTIQKVNKSLNIVH